MQPKTLQQAILHFSDEQTCFDFVAELRWPKGVVCPRCDSEAVKRVATRFIWQCNGCRRQFSVKVGTIFEDSPIPLSKWLPGIWLLASAKNGISSYELSRSLGVTQKSAWFMLHRIRLAMQTGSLQKIASTAEADETFIGGKSENMHKVRRAKRIKSTGPAGKTVVFGLLERHGPDGHSHVRAKVVKNNRRSVLLPEIERSVTPGTEIFTDAHPSYRMLKRDYVHETIDHAEAYVRDRVHTNGLENFWSLLKRAIKGTYVNVEPFHLHRYVDEQAFRFNSRELDDGTRMASVVSRVAGRRLSYNDLTRAPAAP